MREKIWRAASVQTPALFRVTPPPEAAEPCSVSLQTVDSVRPESYYTQKREEGQEIYNKLKCRPQWRRAELQRNRRGRSLRCLHCERNA